MSCAKKTPKKGQDEEDSAKLKQTAHNCTHFDQEEKIVTNESAQEFSVKITVTITITLTILQFTVTVAGGKGGRQAIFCLVNEL